MQKNHIGLAMSTFVMTHNRNPKWQEPYRFIIFLFWNARAKNHMVQSIFVGDDFSGLSEEIHGWDWICVLLWVSIKNDEIETVSKYYS